VAATRLVLEVDDLPIMVQQLEAAPIDVVSRGVTRLARGRSAALVRDPDGHPLA
jgi:hypothetical protein